MPQNRRSFHPLRAFFYRSFGTAVFFTAVWFFTACAPLPTPTLTPTIFLTVPPVTPTPPPSPTVSSTPTPIPETPTPIPSPTSTPRLHIIQAGEDLGGIAYRYHVSVDAILAANPGVIPQLLRIGDSLVIPAPAQMAEQTAAAEPTPIDIQLSQPVCYLSKSGGTWCFTLASNATGQDVENVSAAFFAASSSNSNILSVISTTSLNLLPNGQSLPVAAYFSSPLARPVQASVELRSVLPSTNAAQRYIPVHVEQKNVEIAADGLSAHITGIIVMNHAETAASSIRVLAIGYNASGQVAGIKQKEYNSLQNGGQNLSFDLWLYSAEPKMERVELLVEAAR